MEPCQNGVEYVPEQGIVALLTPPQLRLGKCGAVDQAVVPDEGQVRGQVFRRDKDQLFRRAGVQLLPDGLLLCRKATEKPLLRVSHRLLQQIAGVFVVQVKGRAVDARCFAYLPDGDVSEILTCQQGDKRFVHTDGGVEILAFGFVHALSSCFAASERSARCV